MGKHNFHVKTSYGKLELTKGAYLTLKKRKNLLEKTKIVLKKMKPERARSDIIFMLDCLGKRIVFRLQKDAKRITNKMLKSL